MITSIQKLKVGVLVTALALAAGTPLAAQNDPATPAGADAQSTLRDLRDRIETRYQVLPVRDGVVLMPRYRSADIQTIELSNGTIAIDGQPVTGAELRDRIGEDAVDVTRLSFMEPGSRRVLFGIGAPPVEAEDAADGEQVAAADGDTTADIDEEADWQDTAGTTFVSEEGDQVKVGGSVTVPAGRFIDGDVVAVGGSARIDGHVDGDVVAVGGSVRLGPEAIVEGEVTAVGGTVERAPGSVVHGAVSQVGFFENVHFNPKFGGSRPFAGVGGLIVWAMVVLFVTLLAALAYLVARTPIERMEYRVATSPWKAAVVGLLTWILLIPALVLTCVVLAISIIGIPLLLAVPFALLALKLGALAGFAAVAKHVGHSAESRFGWDHASGYLSVIVGVAIIAAVSFLGSAVGVIGGPVGVFGTLISIVGWVILFVAWTVGMGAFLLTRFGTRYTWDGDGPAPSSTAPATAPTVTV